MSDQQQLASSDEQQHQTAGKIGLAIGRLGYLAIGRLVSCCWAGRVGYDMMREGSRDV